MHKSAGGKSPPTTREKSSLPPENSTWHRDPRTDKTDRDKVGAGKRHWNGDQLSNMTPFQGVTSGASLNGNGFVPRSKPRFQGHYSGFFKETGNRPSFSATGPMDNGLVRRFHRNPYHSGASLAARSQGFSGSVGVDYRASDTEERQNRDQFLSSRDDKGRDLPLPPHTPQVHFDSSLLRNGERTKPFGSRNWEYSPKIDKDNITRPSASADLYSSRRRSIVTQFDSDRGVGDKRSEVGRFERYGNGNRDGRADYESSNKDTGFSHGWRRERGNSGVIARHSSFTAASRNLGEIRARGSLSLGSAHDSLNATTLASNQDFDQPSPSKRPRLGWGQGLAKYEKKVDDVFPSVEKTCMKMDGESDTRRTVEEVVKKRVEHEKHIVLGWEHENKRQHVNSFIDAHERRGENEMKTILISEHGVREVCGQYASSCALLGESLRRKEDERKPTLAQELQELHGRLASPVEMEDCEKYLRAGRDENSGAVFNDNEELDLRGQNPAPPILSGECESRRKDGEVACGLFQELELLKGKNQNYTPSALVEEPTTRQGEIAKNFFPVENFQDILERGCQNASLLEPLNNAKHDLSIFNTLIKAKTKGDLSSSSTSVADCETGGRKTESTLPFSPMPLSEMKGEDRDVVSPIDASPEMSSTGCEKHSSPRSHVVDDFLTAPSILAESFVLPPPSSSHLLIKMGVLESVPGKVQLKSARFEKGVKGARNGSILLSLGSEDSDYPEILFGREVAEGGSLLHKRNQAIIESLVLENKEKARLSGVPFIHLLPQNLTGSLNQQLYHSPIEAPIWHHNAETHKSICDRLLMKIAERRHFSKFKEHVLTLRYRALKEAWKREQKGLFDRRNRPKTVGRWDGDGRSGYGPPSQRLSSRSRLLSMDRLDGESDASQAMKTLLKNLQVEPLRPVLKMPAMILDEKERAVRRFVSRNALVEDPIAVEMERKTLNPWTVDERKIFGEMFAVYNKNFKEIASYLQYKTTADCVEFYYRNKKSEDFGKSQHGIQLKNRWDYSKTSSTFLTPTVAGIKRNHGAICARIEALNVANMNTIPSESNIQLQVLEHVNPLSEPFTMPSNVEMLEMILPFGATMETATSNWISTPCSVSSTAAPAADQCREKDSVKERIRSGPSTTRSSYSEQHPAGLKRTRTTHLRRMSSRAAAQEQDSQWTDAERELFTSAVATFGKNFRLIASHIGTKNQSQCKAFFSKTRKRFCLDELVEQFQANEAASMLVQSFRHDADLAQEVKLINVPEMDAFAGAIAEELIDTAAAVSTLESLKGQSKCLANEMSDLSLVADAAAVMEEITLVKPEAPVLGFFSSGKPLTSSQDLACELLNVNRSSFTVPSILLREEDEEDEDSEATKSDSSYQIGTETENDIVVDQAAAALIGMSEMLADKSGLKRSKSEAKADTRSFPVSVSSRLQSARLSTSCPPSPDVTEANVCVTSGRPSRHAKERTNASITCKAITRDRPQDIHDAHAGRKSREMAGAEPKPRREPTSWTREEKEKFAVILQEHGKDWALLHESLPSKSLTQIKTYFQNSKARSRLPTLDKLLNVVRNDGANRKRKADELESTRRDAELALLVNHKVRGHVASLELDSVTHKEDTLLGPALVSGTAGVGVDILAYAARFGTFSGQTADQDSLSMNGMQHVVRQMVSANTYAQRNTQDGYKVFRPARHALPSSVCLPTPGGIQQLFSASGPSKPVGLDLQALSPDVVSQAGPPAAIQQVAQQVQQMLQQQQHLQKQLNLLIQQQSALPPQLLPQHQQATHQTLQAVRPLEEKLHQVVQHLQQQYELQGRGQAPSQEEGLSRMDHFQHQQITPARGILKVKPIRGAVSTPLVDLVALPSSGVFPNKTKSHNEGIELQQQDHSLSLGIGTIATATAGSTAGVQETYAKTVELQDSDTDTDCEGMGSRLMVTEDSHQRMSIVRSTSSEQQQNTTQSTTSTLSSDSEQAKSCDVKLFGQSLLSKPQSLPSTAPRLARSSTQDFLSPNTSAPVAIMAFPTGTLSKALRTSESLPSAFGKVAALSINAGLQQPTSWLGKYGAWSARSSLEISGVGEISKKIIDSENALEAVTSLAAQSDAKLLVLAAQQAPQMDDEHLDGESGNLSTVQLVTDAVIEGSPFIDKSQSSLNEGQVANSEADQCPIGALGLTQAPSQMSTIPSVLAGHGLWG